MTSVQNLLQRLNGNKMKHIFYVLFFVLAFAKADYLTAQNYQQHTVVKGETLSSISSKYNIAPSELLNLNPDLKNGVKQGAVVLIPADSKLLTQRKVERYKTHKVRRKETLFSLAKEYGVTVLDIKEANKELYNTALKRGERIRIPVFAAPKPIEKKPVLVQETPAEIVNETVPVPGIHEVKQGEGLFRIAILYKTSVDKIQELNPNLEALKPGMLIKVPEVDQSQNTTIPAGSSELVDFEVPRKMGMYSLTRMTGLDQDSLEILNPQLKEGLKAGMMIKIPNRSITDSLLVFKKPHAINLIDSLSNYQPQNIAVMLPLSLNKLSEELELKDHLLSDRTSRIAIDFLNGMYEARDSALSLGLKVNYDVFDTQKSKERTLEVLSGNDFADYNAVVGPLLSGNVVETAKHLKYDRIPVISPLTTTNVRLYSNLFQSRPDDQLMKEQLKHFLSLYGVGKNVIIVTDNTKPQLREEFSALFPEANVLIPSEDKNYIYSVDYIKELKPEVENVVILAVDNVGFITDAVTNYSAKADTHHITMFGMDSYEDMDLPNARLAALHYTFPQMYKLADQSNAFMRSYYKKYGISPNKYVTRGFDIAMDLILRQASADDFFDSVDKHGVTEMTESKFSYSKKLFAGYYNEAIYILQYQQDLGVKEVFVPNFSSN
jgi:LysM repeat protein/ABC-type branched-subunit amino acid transport system substrate-binding protein